MSENLILLSKALLTGVKRRAKWIGLILLLLFTVYGLYPFLSGETDLYGSLAHWEGIELLILIAFVIAFLDYTLEFFCWVWLYRRFGVTVSFKKSILVYLSCHAGLFLPAQTSRLIRPNAIVQLKLGALSDGIKAEAALFYLDAVAALVTISIMACFWFEAFLAPLVGFAVSVLLLFLAERLTSISAKISQSVPKNFWRDKRIFAIIWVFVFGWILNGLALYVLVHDLGQGINPQESIFFATLSRVVGSGTGLPGGIGVVEGVLGLSLNIMSIPVEHLVLAISAYRVVTFWILLPIGWIAFFCTNRFSNRHSKKNSSEMISVSN